MMNRTGTSLIGLALSSGVAFAATGDLPIPGPLNTAVKPWMQVRIDGVKQPDGIRALIKDNQIAIQLGKALFWDVAVGSDGVACATCHYHAGSDHRTTNQINPGLNRTVAAVPGSAADPLSTVFDPLWIQPRTAPSLGPLSGPNAEVTRTSFPFYWRNGPPGPTGRWEVTDDVMASQGSFGGRFIAVDKRKGHDQCEPRTAGSSHAEKDGLAVRLVEPRNAPTVINACLNVRNFWDGRANFVFNGVNPFGNRDPDARVWVRKGRGAAAVRLEVTGASCASQATAPVLSKTEMSCDGRTFDAVGRKLLDREPLARQRVAANDSVLGTLFAYRHGKRGNGHRHGQDKPPLTYRDLVQRAFAEDFWKGKTSTGQPLAEANFSMFFGLAVQAYEKTLFSSQSRFDRLRRENAEPIRLADGTYEGLNASESRGLDLFMGRVSVLNPQVGVDVDGKPVPARNGKCIVCHSGPEFTTAAYTSVAAANGLPPQKFQVGVMPFVTATAGLMTDPNVIDTSLPQRVWDTGFYNIATTADTWDIGLGGVDPWGNPLSFSAQWVNSFGPAGEAAFVDKFTIKTRFLDQEGKRLALTPTLAPAAVVGAFKTPTLRNVELTGPYYHNGSAATLEEAMVAYNPGGFFRNPAKHPAITALGFDGVPDMVDVSNFMRTLTDPRVRYEQAPFDHPELPLLEGHAVDANGQLQADPANPSRAADVVEIVPAVGRTGRSEPLQEFAAELQP